MAAYGVETASGMTAAWSEGEAVRQGDQGVLARHGALGPAVVIAHTARQRLPTRGARRQASHPPHACPACSTTRVPGFHPPATSGPTAWMTPATSWPSVTVRVFATASTGNAGLMLPSIRWTSEEAYARGPYLDQHLPRAGGGHGDLFDVPVGAKEQSAPSHAKLGGAYRRLLDRGGPSPWGPSARHRHRIGSPDDRITVGRLSKTPVSME
jgi:hypothetical protein